ncbi:MAG: divergent PAP2 family protein [Treponema sp.]|jgi:acid phosphatase family membrane protein YuiD|nr:divergent PAP2 family protein [Treponema sp.]
MNTASVKRFFENPIFLAPVTSWFLAQFIKAVIVLSRRRRKKTIKEVIEVLTWRTGGMPSSHSALVTSMTISTAFKEGLDSNIFIISLWFAMIVIRDAMGVRRASGIQGRALNFLGRNVAEKTGIEYHPVKEIHGHTPLEVVVGGLLGIFIAAAYVFL